MAGKVIGRFAPSPSGRMHLGNVFSALVAWLEVRKNGGTMVLRIEDLDPDRCREAYAVQLRRDLTELGLDWDTEQRPQSRGGGEYAEAFARLESRKLLYPCYCSRTQLHAASAPHGSDGTLLYAGTCRNLTAAERAAKVSLPAWRLLVPDRVFGTEDALQGKYEENLARDCGDFIVRRSDGVYAYQLAVVVDDGLAGVNQVVRGRDLLSSVPRQMYLQELLQLPHPQYCHVPLLCDETGRRLSKRDGDMDLDTLLRRYTPAELVGRLAWASGILPEYAPVSPERLVPLYNRENLKKEDIPIRRYFT